MKTKLKKEIEEISTLNSADLLQYSRELVKRNKQTQESKSVSVESKKQGLKVTDYLFGVIDLRRDELNSGLDVKKECELQVMIKNFKKG